MGGGGTIEIVPVMVQQVTCWHSLRVSQSTTLNKNFIQPRCIEKRRGMLHRACAHPGPYAPRRVCAQHAPPPVAAYSARCCPARPYTLSSTAHPTPRARTMHGKSSQIRRCASSSQPGTAAPVWDYSKAAHAATRRMHSPQHSQANEKQAAMPQPDFRGDDQGIAEKLERALSYPYAR